MMDSLATTIERWNEYGRDYAVNSSLWDGSLVFASGPLYPEGATLIDRSGRTSGATWSVGAGDVPKYVQGSVRGQGFWSATHDGTDDMLTAKTGMLNSLTEGTLSFWVNNTSDASGNLIWCGSSTANLNNFVAYGITTGRQPFLEIRANNVTDHYLAYMPAITDGAWTNIVWTKSGSVHAGYSNGVQQALTEDVTADRSKFFDDLVGTIEYTIGALRRNTTVSYHNGLLSDLRWYSRPLATEIAILARHPLEAYRVNVPHYYFVGQAAGFRGPVIGSRIVGKKPSPLFIRGA